MSTRPYRFKVAQSPGSTGWRWTLHAPNGRVIAKSAQAYATKPHAQRSAVEVTTALTHKRVGWAA